MKNFTYEYYEYLMQHAADQFKICPVSKALPAQSSNLGKLFLRHDIDFDVELALPLAELERRLGIASTYFVMVDSPMYSPTRSQLKSLLRLGHEIGLHATTSRGSQIREDAALLQVMAGKHVSAVSFHCPTGHDLHGPFLIEGMVNAYSAQLMRWYLSDSRGVWYEEPLQKLQKVPALQLLAHPVWWGTDHQEPEDRLQSFFDARVQKLSEDMSTYISVQRRG
jgi:hypothetical protein